MEETLNLYGLPEFVAYAMLVGMACVLIRERRDARLRYWLVGWVIILVHAGIFMLLPSTFPFDVLARGLLTLAGQTFMLAAAGGPAARGRTPAWGRIGLWASVNMVFALASTAYGEAGPAYGPAPFYGLILAGAASGLWLARAHRSSFARTAVLLGVVYGVQALCLDLYGVAMASQWLMCWTYFAVAYFFWRNVPRPTMGVLFTALSFVLWGLVFPAYSLIMLYAPTVSANIEPDVWNLPKFLAAAAVILLLLEEKIAGITRLATHDELTGLPNRRLYHDRFAVAVARAQHDGSGFGFLVVDLDRFKLVNDTMGHQAGDQLLQVVAERFRATLRTADLVARTGGDEFTIILEGVERRDDAERIVAMLQEALAEPVPLMGRFRHHPSASIGAAIYPADGLTQLHLQAVADERMYEVKQRSRLSEALPAFSREARTSA
jgi:diguanylate cyclase (GGDEF)-like protein